MNKFVSILIILLNITTLSAQNISFKGSAPKAVAIGQQFNLVYSTNTDIENFYGPNLNMFQKLLGPSPSYSNQKTIVNGKVIVQRNISYTYVLKANKTGKFTIPEAKVRIKGKVYQSNKVIINVVKGNSQNSKTNSSTGLKDDDLFVKTIISKSNVYQGEHLIVTLKLFSRTRNIKITKINYPAFDSFLTSDIEGTPNNLFRENYNGEVYYVGIFKKQVIFPQRSGKITIDPFELDIQVSVQSGQKRNLWGQSVPAYKNVNITLKSKQKIITVKDPGAKPKGFTGAVGSLKMRATVNKTSAKTNDAISLKVKISGTGNLKLIDPLKIIFPPDFEVYDPKIVNSYKTSENGVSGTKTFEYLIIPRHAGEFKIPPVSFTYFDTRTGSYKTLISQEFNLSIEKGNDDQNTTIVSGFSKEDVKFIGKDIRFLKTSSGKLKKKSEYIFGSIMFWLTYIFALLIFISILTIRRKIIKENANVAFIKNKKANKEAKKRLKAASVHLKANEESKFYQEILSAMYGYLSDKLNIPVSDLNKDSALNKLSNFNIDNTETDIFIEFLNKAEFAQYAPGASSSEMQSIYSEGERLIGMFENKIK